MTPEEIEDLIEFKIRYKPGYGLILKQDENEGRYYMQVEFLRMDIITKEMEVGYGGKVYLSLHMTQAEVVRKAFGAFLAVEEHECREWFKVDLGEGPRRVFGPHISIEALYQAAPKVDVRTRS